MPSPSRGPFFDYIWFQQERRPESLFTHAESRRTRRKKSIFFNAAELGVTLDNPETGTRDQYTVRSEATFSKSVDNARKSENENVVVYANVLNAMEKAEEAIQGLDLDRFQEARALFDRFYEAAHQHAIDTRDQQLLNQTFLLRHFMAELSAAGERALIHSHDQARMQIKKEANYRRYLLEHHRQHGP